MKFENLTPAKFASYTIGLANEASKTPGCKVKSHHLLEAAARLENKKNWDTLYAESGAHVPFSFNNKILFNVAGNGVNVVSLSADYQIKGFTSSAGMDVRFDSKVMGGIVQGSFQYNFLNGYMVPGFCPVEALGNAQMAAQHLKSVCDCIDSGELPPPALLKDWSVEFFSVEEASHVYPDDVRILIRQYKSVIDVKSSSHAIMALIDDNLERIPASLVDTLKKLNVLEPISEYDYHTVNGLLEQLCDDRKVKTLLPLSLVNELERVGFRSLTLQDGEPALICIQKSKPVQVSEKQESLGNLKEQPFEVMLLNNAGLLKRIVAGAELGDYYSPWVNFYEWVGLLQESTGFRLPEGVVGFDNQLIGLSNFDGKVISIALDDSTYITKVIKLLKLASGGITLDGLAILLVAGQEGNHSMFLSVRGLVQDAVNRSKKLQFGSSKDTEWLVTLVGSEER